MILLCYGTRPEWIKIKPVIDKIKETSIPYKILFTGQHKHIVNNNADFVCSIPEDIHNNRLNNIFSSILDIPNQVFENISYVLVQGDTSSAVALAINAFHRHIKIIHLEAGLRTYDTQNPFPEEINRQIISRIADIHLCATELNKNNLIGEKCTKNIYVTGNTGLDNLVDIKCSYEDMVLITLHRRENHNLVEEWFKSFSQLAEQYTNLRFIFPIHPNPEVKKHIALLTNISVVDPLSHMDLLDIMSRCKLIITDSGGLQEEASFLNKKTIVCRKTTERIESLAYHGFLCKTPNALPSIFGQLIHDYKVNQPCPYGDGRASDRIIEILKEIYEAR